MSDSFNARYDPERQAWVPVEEQKEQVQAIKPIRATDLMQMDLPPVQWLWQDILPRGQIAVFGAPPKSGKSFLSLDLAISICQGMPYLGRKTERASVLYLDLESGLRRPRDRISDMMQGKQVPENLYLLTADAEPRIQMLGSGFEEQIEGFLRSVPDVGLIVVDVLRKILPPETSQKDGYTVAYQQMGIFSELAHRFNLSFLLIHHTRKSGGRNDNSDFLERLYGSVGVTAAADAVYGLSRKRKSPDAVLEITGKDVSSQELALRFDDKAGKWIYEGTAAEVEERKRVEEFRSSNITKVIQLLVNADPGKNIKVTSSGIIESSGMYLNGRYTIYESPEKVGRFLTDNADLFWSEYCYEVTKPPRTNRNTIYHVKENMPFNRQA